MLSIVQRRKEKAPHPDKVRYLAEGSVADESYVDESVRPTWER